MAANSEFVEYVVDALTGFDFVEPRRMFEPHAVSLSATGDAHAPPFIPPFAAQSASGAGGGDLPQAVDEDCI